MKSFAKLALLAVAAAATFCASAQPTSQADADRRARNREEAIAQHRNVITPVAHMKPRHHRHHHPRRHLPRRR
jgi:Ni/Co efflux regulator RcnB